MPTVASIAVQMTSVLTLIMLLLLMISARPGDAGNDGGGSGNGSSGQDGQGEFAVAATGSGSQNNTNAAGDAASAAQPVDAPESERSASAPRANPQRPPQNAGVPLTAQAENRKKFFVMPDFPAPAANLEPAGAGGGDGFSDLEDRLRRAGAQSGDVQISLAWNNGNDIDLHVETPGGEKIFFQSACIVLRRPTGCRHECCRSGIADPGRERLLAHGWFADRAISSSGASLREPWQPRSDSLSNHHQGER